MSEKLRYSVENNFEGFRVFYQPQVNKENKVIGSEALLRWTCEGYGEVDPKEMIPLLEKSMIIHSIGIWVLRNAIKQCKEWIQYVPDFVMHVNISYLQIEDKNFANVVEEILKEYDLSPEHLVIELTEEYFIKSYLIDTFKRLRDINVKIAMDDFGTGYSSLGVLKKLPVDIVKVDKSFIREMKDSRFDVMFIRFIVELCHVVNIDVCLEGIETFEEYEIIKELDLNTMQGFFFGKPVNNDMFERIFLK